MTSPCDDHRDLIQRLTDALTAYHQLPGRVPLITEARAYLAQLEPEGPTDEELEKLADDSMAMDGATGVMFLSHLDYARAVLARYGNRTPAPSRSLSASRNWRTAEMRVGAGSIRLGVTGRRLFSPSVLLTPTGYPTGRCRCLGRRWSDGR